MQQLQSEIDHSSSNNASLVDSKSLDQHLAPRLRAAVTHSVLYHADLVQRLVGSLQFDRGVARATSIEQWNLSSAVQQISVGQHKWSWQPRPKDYKQNILPTIPPRGPRVENPGCYMSPNEHRSPDKRSHLSLWSCRSRRRAMS